MKGMKVSVFIVFAMLAIGLISGCVIPADATPRGNTITLPGTTWILIRLNGEDIDVGITLQFDDEQVSGSASCNRYFGQYTLSGEELSFGPIGSTMMACENMENESAYLKALSEVVKLRFDREQLILMDGAGSDNLVFVPMQHASLEGTNWILTGWNTGSAISSVVIDSEITLEMADGQASGTAGCNHYFAGYEVADESLSFGMIGSTEMYCMEPEGVMEQEVGYLKVLGQVGSYDIYGNVLTLLDKQGTRLMTFTVQ